MLHTLFPFSFSFCRSWNVSLCIKITFCSFLQDEIVCAPYVLAQYLKEMNFRKKVYVVGAAAIAQELQKAGIRCIGVGVSE